MNELDPVAENEVCCEKRHAPRQRVHGVRAKPLVAIHPRLLLRRALGAAAERSTDMEEAPRTQPRGLKRSAAVVAPVVQDLVQARSWSSTWEAVKAGGPPHSHGSERLLSRSRMARSLRRRPESPVSSTISDVRSAVRSGHPTSCCASKSRSTWSLPSAPASWESCVRSRPQCSSAQQSPAREGWVTSTSSGPRTGSSASRATASMLGRTSLAVLARRGVESWYGSTCCSRRPRDRYPTSSTRRSRSRGPWCHPGILSRMQGPRHPVRVDPDHLEHRRDDALRRVAVDDADDCRYRPAPRLGELVGCASARSMPATTSSKRSAR